MKLPPRFQRGPGERRALVHYEGAIETEGSVAEAQVLARALERTQAPFDSLTHGFHSYTARMHPAIAATLLEAFSAPESRVLDPFCGSGTTRFSGRYDGCFGDGC